MAREWLVDNTQVHEDGEEEYFVNNVQINENQPEVVAGNPWYHYANQAAVTG